MNLQRMKSGKDYYISLDLLDQGQGIDGFSNVEAILKDYGTTIRNVYNSNINYNEKSNEFNLEQHSEQINPAVIIEEDMFGKMKVWLKSSKTSEYLISKINSFNVIDQNIKNKILNESINKFYNEEKIAEKIKEKFNDDLEIKENEKNIILKFSKILKESDLCFHTDNGQCSIHLSKKEKENIIEKIFNEVEKSISTKNFLLKKSSKEDSKNKNKKKVKP